MNQLAHTQSDLTEAELTKLKLLVLEVCKKYQVRKTQDCMKRFLALAKYYRDSLKTAESEICNDGHWHLQSIIASSAQLAESLKAIREQEHISFPGFIKEEISNLPLLLETINSHSNKLLQSKAYNKKIYQRITRSFIVICLEFGIPIRWSKELSSCSETSSSYLLGAIFAAGGMQDNGDDKTIKRANYYLGEERSGFTCDSEGIIVQISFAGLRIMPNPLISELINSALAGSPPPSIKRIPKVACQDHEIGLRREFVLSLMQRQTLFTK